MVIKMGGLGSFLEAIVNSLVCVAAKGFVYISLASIASCC